MTVSTASRDYGAVLANATRRKSFTVTASEDNEDDVTLTCVGPLVSESNWVH